MSGAKSFIPFWVLLGFTAAPILGGASKPYATWSDYSGAPDSMQYSALAQINKKIVSRLKLAWWYAAPGPTGRF